MSNTGKLLGTKAKCGHPYVKTLSGEIVPDCMTLAAGKYNPLALNEEDDIFPSWNIPWRNVFYVLTLLGLLVFLSS